MDNKTEKSQRQPKWDIFEAAILLDGFLQTQLRTQSKLKTVKSISLQLRQMAINRGLNINDVYRNENGISYQIKSMESAFKGKTIFVPATKLFIEIVDLYNTDRAKYDTILKEAKEMIDKTNILIYTDEDSDKKRNLRHIQNSSVIHHENEIHTEKDYSCVDFSKYQELLKQHFPRGFRLNDTLDIKKFRKYWLQSYGKENSLENEIIWEHIEHITILHNKLSYLPEMMVEEPIKSEILQYIDKTFADGKNVIFYESIYQTFREKLDSGRINNVEMLKTYLEYVGQNKYYFQKHYLTASQFVDVNIADEVRNYLKSCGTSVTVDEITSFLSHLDRDKIRLTLSGNNSDEFVRNKKGEYFHADIVDLTQTELSRIRDWIQDYISRYDYISGNELLTLIHKHLPEIHEKHSFLTDLGLRDAIGYKLKNEFAFNAQIISNLSDDLDMAHVCGSFARTHTPFTLAQIEAFGQELGTSIYFENVYQNAMRISKNEFVSISEANFDCIAIDEVIAQFCTDDVLGLHEITLFNGFPDCKFPWNTFLLEYYVAYFSQKFMLLHTTFNKDKAVGAIVRKNSEAKTFKSSIVKALAQSNTILNADNALNYLYKNGFLAKRKFGKIDSVVMEAKAYRAGKGV